MPPSTTPLNARSQTLISVLLGTLAMLGFSPIAQVIVEQWPPRFGQLLWRYFVYGGLLLNIPQVVLLTAFIAIFCVLTGNRAAVRGTAVVFGVAVALQVLLVPLYTLDYFQVRRVLPASDGPRLKALLIKTVLFAMIAIIGAAWAAYAAWLASEREGSGSRRKKGEGLVVGQPKEPRPPT